MATSIDDHSEGGLPTYARAQLVFATVTLFVVNALSFTAFAYLPVTVSWRLFGSLAVVPYGAFVAWTAVVYADFLTIGPRARNVARIGLLYGLIVLSLTLVHRGEDGLSEFFQALGLGVTVLTFGVLLPSMLKGRDYAAIIVWILRSLAPLAILGLYLEITKTRTFFAIPLLMHPLRDSSQTTFSLFVHHTVVAQTFQWLPLLALSAKATYMRPHRSSASAPWRSWCVDIAAAGFCASYVAASGSRQGALFLVFTGLAALYTAPSFKKADKSWALLDWRWIALALASATYGLIYSALPKASAGFELAGNRLTGRLTLWHEAIVRILVDEKFILGYGIRPGLINGWMPHNSPLSYFAGFGIFGLAAFLGTLGVAIYAATEGQPSKALRVVVLTSVFCLLVQMGFEDFALRPYSSANLSLWLLLGCLYRVPHE